MSLHVCVLSVPESAPVPTVLPCMQRQYLYVRTYLQARRFGMQFAHIMDVATCIYPVTWCISVHQTLARTSARNAGASIWGRVLGFSAMAAAAPALPIYEPRYPINLGRQISIWRVHEAADGAELHVDYGHDHGWFVYRHRRADDPVRVVGTEVNATGEARALTSNRSAFIRQAENFDPHMSFRVLPNLVMRWLINEEGLVYQLVVQRNSYYDQRARVLASMATCWFQVSSGNVWHCRVLSSQENNQWTIHFQIRAADQEVWSNMIYNAIPGHQWMAPEPALAPHEPPIAPVIVPVRVARYLSRAIGIETRDGFWHV